MKPRAIATAAILATLSLTGCYLNRPYPGEDDAECIDRFINHFPADQIPKMCASGPPDAQGRRTLVVWKNRYETTVADSFKWPTYHPTKKQITGYLNAKYGTTPSGHWQSMDDSWDRHLASIVTGEDEFSFK